MSIATLITEGVGSFGDVAHVITDGLDIGVPPSTNVIATILTEGFGMTAPASPFVVTEGFGAARVIVRVDTHDGGKKRDERYRKQKEAKERLRDQIRMALDGPQAPEIIPALEALAEPGAGALEYRVEMDRLLQQAEVWRMVRAAAEAYARNEREIDEDDEEVLTFL